MPGLVFVVFSYISGYIALLAFALSAASGLYVLVGLAEENSVLTGKILRYYYRFTVAVQILLWIDGLPLRETIVSLSTFVAYNILLQSFPTIPFLSFATLVSIFGFILCNFMWLKYFLSASNEYNFVSIVGYYIVMVWTLPIGLFISMTLNDHALPGAANSLSPASSASSFQSMEASFTHGGRVEGVRGQKNLFKTIYDLIYETFSIFRIRGDKKK